MKKNLFLCFLFVAAVFATSCKKQTFSGSASGKSDVYSRECFYIEAVDSNTVIGMEALFGSTSGISFEYSINLPDWKPFVVGETSIKLAQIGDKVFVRAKGNNNVINCHFFATRKVKVGGNIMFLLDEKGEKTTLSNNSNGGAFQYLFYDMAELTDASDLYLPAVSLSDYCYQGLFAECTSLKSAPKLPAERLATGCYQYMFEKCTALEAAPKLPAKRLAENCYEGMFAGCESLTKSPEILATTLSRECCMGMFFECESLTNAPELPATKLAEGCYAQMFAKCTSLSTLSKLPASELVDKCYYLMFDSCISLKTAPELPAKELAPSCYYAMFSNCSSLTTVPTLPAEELVSSCYYGMFYNCTSLRKAPTLPAAELVNSCYSMMFYGCESLNSVDVNFTSWNSSSTNHWLEGVAENGTFRCTEDLDTFRRGVTYIPSEWNISLKNN